MATVFLKNDNIKINVPVGTTMRSLAEKSGASMIFGCRVGDCGTCIARVSEGMEYLSALNEKEEKLLQMIDSRESDVRFMCQCSVTDKDGNIVIEYI